MAFRFYITDIGAGKIVGTNSIARAKNCAACEDYFVVDSVSGEWLTSDDRTETVEELPSEHSAQSEDRP